MRQERQREINHTVTEGTQLHFLFLPRTNTPNSRALRAIPKALPRKGSNRRARVPNFMRRARWPSREANHIHNLVNYTNEGRTLGNLRRACKPLYASRRRPLKHEWYATLIFTPSSSPNLVKHVKCQRKERTAQYAFFFLLIFRRSMDVAASHVAAI